MIYSSMLTMCVLMNPLSKKDLTQIFWLGQPSVLLLLIWNQKAHAPSPQRVISILWILIIGLNLLMHIRQSVNSFILRWYQVKRESRMALKSWQRILGFQMRRKFSLFLILLPKENNLLTYRNVNYVYSHHHCVNSWW